MRHQPPRHHLPNILLQHQRALRVAHRRIDRLRLALGGFIPANGVARSLR